MDGYRLRLLVTLVGPLMDPLALHVLLGGPPGGGKAVLWCLACSWISLERWTGDASLANCVSIRAAARLGSSLSDQCKYLQ
jgi:hypothetical protein